MSTRTTLLVMPENARRVGPRRTGAVRRVLSAGLTGALAAGVAAGVAPAADAAQHAATAAAPATAAVATHTAAQRHGSGIAARYTWESVAPARMPDGSPNTDSSRAVGIDASGRVAGNVSGDAGSMPFIGGGRGAGWLGLERAGSQLRYVMVQTVSASGLVVGSATVVDPAGSARDYLTTWGRDRRPTLTALPTPHPTSVFPAATAGGTFAGKFSDTKTDTLLFGTVRRVVTVADPKPGNYDVRGISQAGTAVGTWYPVPHQGNPAGSEGIVFTAAGVRRVRAGSNSAVDAISPNGRFLIGRVGTAPYQEGSGRAAWLSTSRNPALLTGAAGLQPKAVSNAGVVAGSRHGRAVLWQNGQLVDLTGRARRLPAGWVLTDAVAINAAGTLAVNATDRAGRAIALKLNPTR